MKHLSQSRAGMFVVPQARLIRVFTVLVFLVLVAASAAAGPIFQWEIKSETATLTLVGSIHVGKADFFPLAASFEDAFTASDALAVEVNMADPANMQQAQILIMQKGMLPGETTLKDRLSPELMIRLEAFAAEREVPMAMYQKFKPGIVAMILAMGEYQRQGFDPELGIDKHFLDQAGEVAKPILELEKLEDQLDLFFAIDDQLDDVILDQFMDEVGELAEQLEKMANLWKTGDVDGLDKFLQEQIGDDPSIAGFYRQLMDDRNVKMAETIDTWLHGDQDIFVVVGAGHFAGRMGILHLLAEKGWKITQSSAS
ncbi:MAG: TraB/GumN family protein [Gemmatimonadales bacterium]|nr:TraB/GumN family protein [Gemmatimonadales bacterium]